MLKLLDHTVDASRMSAKTMLAFVLLGCVLVAGCGSNGGSGEDTPAGYYPPAESKAGDVSAARQQFIDQVDMTCANTFNSPGGGPTEQYDALKALGPAPDGQDLYEQWLDTVRKRAELKQKYEQQVSDGDSSGAMATLNEIIALKVKANEVGPKFGLRICTSNGPGKQPTT